MRLLSFFERKGYEEKRCHNAKNGNFGQPLENRHRRLGKEIFLRILDEEMIKERQAEERIKQVFCPYHAENRECIKCKHSGIQKKAQHGMYSARKAEGFIGEECHTHRHGKCCELRKFPTEKHDCDKEYHRRGDGIYKVNPENLRRHRSRGIINDSYRGRDEHERDGNQREGIFSVYKIA